MAKYKLGDLRIVLFGAGTAGTGIGNQIRDAIAVESNKSSEDALKQFWCVDKPGLLLKSLDDKLTPQQRDYARDDKEWHDSNKTSLLDVIKEVKPHVLIGTSTKPGAFTKEIAQEMAKHVDRPIVFPLSNPTRLHEAVPKDLFEWTKVRFLLLLEVPSRQSSTMVKSTRLPNVTIAK